MQSHTKYQAQEPNNLVNAHEWHAALKKTCSYTYCLPVHAIRQPSSEQKPLTQFISILSDDHRLRSARFLRDCRHCQAVTAQGKLVQRWLAGRSACPNTMPAVRCATMILRRYKKSRWNANSMSHTFPAQTAGCRVQSAQIAGCIDQKTH